jgi:hypothetical protein
LNSKKNQKQFKKNQKKMLFFERYHGSTAGVELRPEMT